MALPGRAGSCGSRSAPRCARASVWVNSPLSPSCPRRCPPWQGQSANVRLRQAPPPFCLGGSNPSVDRVTYRNSFITDLPVNRDTVAELAACGRARWKIENETFNVLKNNGYHIGAEGPSA